MSTCVAQTEGVPIPGPAHSFALFLIVFFAVYLVASNVAFLKNKSISVIMRKRKYSHVVVLSVGALGMLSLTAVYDYVGASAFPCVLLSFLFHFCSTSFASIALILKMVQYNSKTKLVYLCKKIKQTEGRAPSAAAADATTGLVDQLSSQPSDYPAVVSSSSVRAYARLLCGDRKRATMEEKLLSVQFMKSYCFIFIWLSSTFAFGVVGFLVRLASDPDLQHNCTGCRLAPFEVALQLANDCWGITIALFLFPRKSLKQDTLRILTEIRVLYYTSLFGLPAFILYLADPEATTFAPHFNVLTIILLKPLAFIYVSTWQQIFLAKRTKRDLFSNMIDLETCYAETLSDPHLNREMRNHLDAELSSEIYWFMDAVSAFKQSPTPAAAAHIMSHFVNRGARYEVNVSSRARDECIAGYAAGNLHSEMFDAMLEEVRQSFLHDGFLRFLIRQDAGKSTSNTIVSSSSKA